MKAILLLLLVAATASNAQSIYLTLNPAIASLVMMPVIDLPNLNIPAVDWYNEQVLANYIATQSLGDNAYPWESLNDFHTWLYTLYNSWFMTIAVYSLFEIIGFWVAIGAYSRKALKVSEAKSGCCSCFWNEDPYTSYVCLMLARGIIFFGLGIALFLIVICWSRSVGNHIFLAGNFAGFMWATLFLISMTSGCMDFDFFCYHHRMEPKVPADSAEKNQGEDASKYMDDILRKINSHPFIRFHHLLYIATGVILMWQSFYLKQTRFASYQFAAGGLFIIGPVFYFLFKDTIVVYGSFPGVTAAAADGDATLYGITRALLFSGSSLTSLIGSVLVMNPANQVNTMFFHFNENGNWYAWYYWTAFVAACLGFLIVFIHLCYVIMKKGKEVGSDCCNGCCDYATREGGHAEQMAKLFGGGTTR